MSVWTPSAASCVAVTAATFWPRTDAPASLWIAVSLELWRRPSETFVCLQPHACMLSTVRSTGKSNPLMSAGSCSFTCHDFLNMQSGLLQLKLKLGSMQSPQQVNSKDSATCGCPSVDIICNMKQNRTRFCLISFDLCVVCFQVPGLANSSNKLSVSRAGKSPHRSCLPGSPGPPGAPGVPGNVDIDPHFQL